MWLDRAPTDEEITNSEEPERGVLELLRDVAHRRQPPRRLAEAARAAPEGFSDRAIDFLIGGASAPAAAESIAQALEHLVRQRGSVPGRLEASLPELLDTVTDVKVSAELGVTCVEHGSPHIDLVVTHVVRYLYSRRGAPLGAREEWVLPLIQRLALVAPERLAEAVSERLNDPDAHARGGAAEAAERLGVLAPTVAARLRTSLLDAIRGRDWLPFDESDGEVIEALAALYLAAPLDTDADIARYRARARPRQSQAVLRVYASALRRAGPFRPMGEYLADLLEHGRGVETRAHAPDGIGLAILDRVIAVMEAEQELDTWDAIADVLQEGSGALSPATLFARSNRLTYLLTEADRLRRTPAPEIVVPGVPNVPDALRQLMNAGRDVRWQRVAARIGSAIGAALMHEPATQLPQVAEAIENLVAGDPDGMVRYVLVGALEHARDDAIGRRALVPLLYRLLMHEHALVRLAAVELSEDLIRRHQSELPPLVSETVAALVLEGGPVGHAAVRAIRWLRPEGPEQRRRLGAHLLTRLATTRGQWEEQEDLAIALMQVLAGEADLASGVLRGHVKDFFATAPTLYSEKALKWIGWRTMSPSYAAAYLECVISFLGRTAEANNEPSSGHETEATGHLSRIPVELLTAAAEQIQDVGNRLVPRRPDVALALTTVLQDALRPDLAVELAQRLGEAGQAGNRRLEWIAKVAKASALHFSAETAVNAGESHRARTLLASAEAAFDELEYPPDISAASRRHARLLTILEDAVAGPAAAAEALEEWIADQPAAADLAQVSDLARDATALLHLLRWAAAVRGAEVDAERHRQAARAEAQVTLARRAGRRDAQSLAITTYANAVLQVHAYADIAAAVDAIARAPIQASIPEHRGYLSGDERERGLPETTAGVVGLTFYLDGSPWVGSRVLAQGTAHPVDVKVRLAAVPADFERCEVDVISTASEHALDWRAVSFERQDFTNGEAQRRIHVVPNVPTIAGDAIEVRARSTLTAGGQRHELTTIGTRTPRIIVTDAGSLAGRTSISQRELLVLNEVRRLAGGIEPEHLRDLERLLHATIRLQDTYLADGTFQRTTALLEREFQALILHDLRLMLGAKEVHEKERVGGGELDLRHRSVVDELKVERDDGDLGRMVRRYAGQTAQYAATTVRQLGLLTTLDLTKKEALGEVGNYVRVVERKTAAESGLPDGRPLICVLVVIAGNYPLPSDVH